MYRKGVVQQVVRMSYMSVGVGGSRATGHLSHLCAVFLQQQSEVFFVCAASQEKMAMLTLGCAGVGVLMCRTDLAPPGRAHKFLGGASTQVLDPGSTLFCCGSRMDAVMHCTVVMHDTV